MKNNENSSSQTQEYLAEAWKEFQDHFESEEEFLRTIAIWPVCPDCGRRREVTCPVCHCSGNLFPPADAEFWVGSDDTSPVSPSVTSGCGCDDGACHRCSGQTIKEPDSHEGTKFSSSSDLISHTDVSLSGDFADLSGKDDPTGQNTVWQFSDPETESGQDGNFSAASDSIYTSRTFSVSTPNFHRSTIKTLDMTPERKSSPEEISRKFHKEGLHLVLCPTCDEPFVPKYLPVCKGCGRRFGDSSESFEQTSLSDADEISLEAAWGRVALVAVGLLLLAILFVLFFIFF